MRERYDREGAIECVCGGESRHSACGTREKRRGDPKSKRNSQLRLDRMRVLGCGVSSPPDKRQQFSSVDSARNIIRTNAGEAGVGNDSSARTFTESAESFARGASSTLVVGRVVKDEGKSEEDRKRSLRGLKDRRHCDTASFGLASKVGEREYVRNTCFTLGKSRKQLYGIFAIDSVPPTSGAILRTRSLAIDILCNRHSN